MKKLFYIANIRLPTEKAHGLQIMKSCEAFAHAGISVELIVPRRLNPLQAEPFSYYGVRKNFTITRLPILDTVSFGRIGFWFESVFFLLLARLYLSGKKGVVYTREVAAGFFFSDFVLELHTLPSKLYFLPHRIFVLTGLLKQELIARGIDQKRISVLPDAVDITQFDISLSKEEARKKVHLPHDKKIVMYTGSFFLYDWKGVDVLIEAARAFQDDTLFVLVGGSGKETKNILCIGHKPPTEIPVYLKAADVLVVPNKKGNAMSEKYTSPLKLFEYMASGRPIVCSDLPSLREVVGEKETLFFKPNSAESLARALAAALTDDRLAETISANARAKAEQFSWERRAKKALAFIGD